MLMQKDSPLSTHGELAAKRRMTRTMGIAMFVMAFEWFVYLPPILCGLHPGDPLYKVFFIVMLMLTTPVVYAVMLAVVQRKVNVERWICALGAPFLLLAVWQMIAPLENDVLLYIGAALSVASYLYLLIKFASEYRMFVARIRSEYSDTTDREIAWSWICFSAFAIQGILFILYDLFWMPVLEVIYDLFSIVNLGYLCFCISKQRAIDVDIIDDGRTPQSPLEGEDQYAHGSQTGRSGWVLLYAEMEQKLRTLCEDKLLYLDPDITLETLALRLGTNRTYMGIYFRERNLSFYQYINTLRIEYANRLMQDNPQLPLRKIAEQAGFNSQPTFRKAFQEVMGCLPSEVRKEKI